MHAHFRAGEKFQNKSGTVKSSRKNNSDTSVSRHHWGPIEDAPETCWTSEHAIVLRSLRGALNWAHIMPL